jgi:hypothetical protein
MSRLALLVALVLCACSEAPKPAKGAQQAPSQSTEFDGTPVSGAAGSFVLVCNPAVNEDSGVRSCRTPRPQRDYLLFRNNTKWLKKGGTQPLTLAFMQDYSVSYRQGENVGLLPANDTEHEGFCVYWLLSWEAR